MPFAQTSPRERALDEVWHGRPVGNVKGPHGKAYVLVNVLWSHGIVSREAARRQGVTLKRLAGYLRVSPATMSRMSTIALAMGVIEVEEAPDLKRGGSRGRFTWLTEEGKAVAPAIVDYQIISAGLGQATVSGSDVMVRAVAGEAVVEPRGWTPLSRTPDPRCPECEDEYPPRNTPGLCKRHRWTSELVDPSRRVQ